MLAFLFGRRRTKETASLVAIAEASSSLKRIKQRNAEVAKVVTDLRTAREKNHFSEQITRLHTT